MSLQRMAYDAASGTVIYRSKMHAGLKRNFQVMSGAAWLELLCRHIPDRYEHLVRYVGWYSNRARGARAKKARLPTGVTLPSPDEAPVTEFAARAKAAWALLATERGPPLVAATWPRNASLPLTDAKPRPD